MSIIPSIEVTSDAIRAGQKAMDIVAENIANQYTTRGPDGGVYQTKNVSFESYLQTSPNKRPGIGSEAASVRIADVTKDSTPGTKLFSPGHPHADDKGFVEMPNVRISEQMVNLVKFSRWVEAEYAVAKASVDIAKNALSLGRS